WSSDVCSSDLARLGQLRHDPAFAPCAVDDRVLDRLDTHRIVVDVQRTRRLAGRGADAAGELREVVGRMQHLDGIAPVVAVHEVVEVRNDVVDRTAAVAERRAAVHAARALDLRLLGIQADHELLVVLDALVDALVALFEALVFEEASDLAHDVRCSFVITWPGWPWSSSRSSSPWRSSRRPPWPH